MAVPQRQPDSATAPGVTRRTRAADFSYLGEASNDDRYASIDEQYAGNAYQDNLLKPVGLGKAEAANDRARQDPGERGVDDATPEAPRQRSRASQVMQNMLRDRLAKKAVATLTTASGRVRASAINAEAFSWQGPLWLFVQLPLAVFSFMMLAMVAAMDQVQTAAAEGGVAAWIINRVTEAASALASLFGVDFLEIAASLYFLTTALLWGIGILSFLFLYLQYTIGLLRPLSGEAMGLKLGLVLLMYIGYALPIANMFPFILLWMAAVWYYPR